MIDPALVRCPSLVIRVWHQGPIYSSPMAPGVHSCWVGKGIVFREEREWVEDTMWRRGQRKERCLGRVFLLEEKNPTGFWESLYSSCLKISIALGDYKINFSVVHETIILSQLFLEFSPHHCNLSRAKALYMYLWDRASHLAPFW